MCERRALSRAYQGRSARGKARGFRTRADPQDGSLRYLADLPLCAPEQPKVSRQFGPHRPGLISSAHVVGERRALSRAYQGRSARGKARGFRTRADPQDGSLRYLADLHLCAPEQPKVSRPFGTQTWSDFLERAKARAALPFSAVSRPIPTHQRSARPSPAGTTLLFRRPLTGRATQTAAWPEIGNRSRPSAERPCLRCTPRTTCPASVAQTLKIVSRSPSLMIALFPGACGAERDTCRLPPASAGG